MIARERQAAVEAYIVEQEQKREEEAEQQNNNMVVQVENNGGEEDGDEDEGDIELYEVNLIAEESDAEDEEGGAKG